LSELDDGALACVLERKQRKSSHPIFHCYDYFKDRIEKKVSGNLENGLRELWSNLLEKVYVVHINAFNDNNAYQLFETLNDRGLELSAVDLIKNFLLKKISNNNQKLKESVILWNEMFENVRDIEPVKFFRRYMLSRFKGKVPERRLNKVLRNIIEKDEWEKGDILDFIDDLKQKSDIYRHIHRANFHDASDINRKLQHLQLVEVGPSYTLLLKLFPFYKNDLLTEEDIIGVLDKIEAFHIRWGICGQSTSSLDTIYNEICIDLPAILNAEDSAGGLLFLKNKLDKEISENVDDNVFETNFNKRVFKPSEKRTKYILWKLSKPTGETNINIHEIQTEHIMPKTLSDHWIKYLKDKTGLDQVEIAEKHEANIDRPGNLTIIKGKWNDSISNNLFEHKKGQYKESEFKITKELCDWDKWTFDEIEKRNKELSKSAQKIWK
jgi:hypothetical protein